MTDGQNNSGKVDPLTVAEAAQSLGVKVYTIGVGMQGKPRCRFRDVFGRETIPEWCPWILTSRLCRKSLRKTGGRYYRADNAKKFQEIYAEIDKLEKTEAEVKKFSQHRELFAWFYLAGGWACCCWKTLLRHTVWRRLP
jgi:Ca-activated chloride channel family protein